MQTDVLSVTSSFFIINLGLVKVNKNMPDQVYGFQVGYCRSVG